MAPLLLIERTRGRWRLLLLIGYAIVIGIAGFFLWRGTSLLGLSDIGDPFDTEAFVRATDLPRDRNAFDLYHKAAAMLVPHENPAHTKLRHDFITVDWPYTPPDIRAWVDANRPALEIWLKGTARSEAVPISPGTATIRDYMRVRQQIEPLTAVAVKEAARLGEAGESEKAWAIYLGALRASFHMQRFGGYGQIGRSNGALAVVVNHIHRLWLYRARNDVEPLRQAISDLKELKSLQGSIDESLKVDYLLMRNTLRSPDEVAELIQQSEQLLDVNQSIRWPVNLVAFSRREPERSARVFQHIYSNWLREVQKPITAQKMFVPEADARSQSATDSMTSSNRELPPDQLKHWLDSTLIARCHVAQPPVPVTARLFAESDWSVIQELMVAIATRLYELENGQPPARMKALVGKYLDELPPKYAQFEAVLDAREATAKALDKSEAPAGDGE